METFYVRKFSETFITIICSEIGRNGDGYESIDGHIE